MRARVQRRNREGVVGVWMVVALMALMGMAALVFDVGRLTIAAQHVQNVADSAALAGALQLPEFGACEERLAAMVATSNEQAPVWAVTVTPEEDLVYYGPTQNVPDYGVLGNGEYAITVTAHSIVNYTFARLFGINEVEVIRAATALSTGSGLAGDGLFFAGETRSNVTGITANGSNLTVEGIAHSNTKVRVNGSNFTLADSLIVCTGDIVFNGSNVALDRVTLVAQGTITFNGSTERFSHFQDDLFAMSLSSASTAIKVNGSNSDTWGVLFAPNGGMIYNGSNQEIHHGALVALTIDVNGSGSRFQGFGEGGDGAQRSVRLIN